MRKVRIYQQNFGDAFPNHRVGREMAAMSNLLDEEPGILELVHGDLTAGAGVSGAAGRSGMTAEQVFRCAILKSLQGLTYDQLEIFIQDNASFRAFARLRADQDPSDSTLQENISLIRPGTWEAIHRLIVKLAEKKGIEKGRKVRIDTTVVEANIHPPTDATLLFDGIRVLTRLLKEGTTLEPIPQYTFCNHLRVAKRRVLAIANAKADEARVAAYRDLMEYAGRVAGYAGRALLALHSWEGSSEVDEAHGQWVAREMMRVLALLKKVMNQTDRRVFRKEQVPAPEKVVSLFEEHADVIVKGRRGVEYGHKVCLASGDSNLVLDCLMEGGNPADSELYGKMVGRQSDLYGRPPLQTAADGGFASKDNLAFGKEAGVKDVCFAKKRGLSVAAMVKSPWVFRVLRNFRAGIEANISVLKRAFGMDRCTWSGWEGFLSYVWNAVIAYNLAVMARMLLA
jgi:IS5 family transposase